MFDVCLPLWEAIFSIFVKNSRNCYNFLLKPQMGMIHRNAFYEPLTTFLRRTMRSVQVSKSVKK